MSQNKAFCQARSSTNNPNLNLSNKLKIIFNDLIKIFNQKLFFDQNLSFDQMINLLRSPTTFEVHFVQFVENYINNSTLKQKEKDFLLINLYKLSRTSVLVYPIVFSRFPDDGDDEELGDVDDVQSELSSDEYDSYDDIENELLDQLDYEHFLNITNCVSGCTCILCRNSDDNSQN